MAKQNYKPIVKFSYARRLKGVRPGRINYFKFRGKRVRTYVTDDGRQVQILKVPKRVLPEFSETVRKAEKLLPYKGKLMVIKKGEPKPPPERRPIPKEPPPPKPSVKPKLEPKPEPKVEVEPSPPTPPPRPKPLPAAKPPVLKKPRHLSEGERRKAKMVPVPDRGPIPTPYIDWTTTPQHCRISGVIHHDYPVPGAPKGMLPALREMFKRSRRYQDEVPVNVLIQGPKGTGKSQLIKKFAEDTGLPYWSVIGQEGIRADELLGHYELKEGTSRWIDGVIPRAVRSGGILHIDEPNVIEPAILMRLDELLDNKRQLNMEDLNGEIVKAHPDLFIVFTMNPPTYEGVKALPDPIVSRLTKRFPLDYPPKSVEYRIVEAKLRAIAVKPGEFKVDRSGTPRGTLASSVVDFMKIIDGLRRDPELTYTPSLRETIGFVQDLREGDNFHTAFDRNVKSWYWGEEADKVEEALIAVRRR